MSFEIARKHVLSRVALPPEILDKAIRVIDEKLSAKKTQFFAFKGRVTDKRDVDDHTTQLGAAAAVLDMMEIGKKTDNKNANRTPKVVLTINEKGVMSLAIGGDAEDEVITTSQTSAQVPVGDQVSPDQIALPLVDGLAPLVEVGEQSVGRLPLSIEQMMDQVERESEKIITLDEIVE